MRVLAIGDIHGCFRALKKLEETVQIRPEDLLITLGDYVDRGPDSKSVLDWLIARESEGRFVGLIGNHEKMMQASKHGPQYLKEWCNCGGSAALRSYGTDDPSGIPDAHWEFLDRCRMYCERKTHFFVHANALPDYDLKDQPDYALVWESLSNPVPHESGKVMVCGHTPQRSGKPLNLGHTICIDTLAHGGGWLTCLDVTSGRCWQSNEEGETREFFIDEC